MREWFVCWLLVLGTLNSQASEDQSALELEIREIVADCHHLDMSDSELLTHPRLQRVYCNANAHVADAVKAMRGDRLTMMEKHAVGCAMQGLPLEDFLGFVVEVTEHVARNPADEDLLTRVLFPGTTWSLALAQNFEASDVRSTLTAVKNSPAATESLRAAIDRLLSGHTLQHYRLMFEVEGFPFRAFIECDAGAVVDSSDDGVLEHPP